MKYRAVHSGFWEDDKIRSLSPDGTLIALYLLTNPKANALGCYHVPLLTIAADTFAKDIDVTRDFQALGDSCVRSSQALAEVEGIAWARYDHATGWVWIRQFLRFNRPNTVQQKKSVTNLLCDIPPSVCFYGELLSLNQGLCKDEPRLAARSRAPEDHDHDHDQDIDQERGVWGGNGQQPDSTIRPPDGDRQPTKPPDGEDNQQPPPDPEPPPAGPTARSAPTPKKSERAKPRAVVRADWRPGDAERQYALDRGVDPDAEAENFRDYHRAKGTLFADVRAGWQRWVRNTVKFAAERSAGRTDGGPAPPPAARSPPVSNLRPIGQVMDELLNVGMDEKT